VACIPRRKILKRLCDLYNTASSYLGFDQECICPVYDIDKWPGLPEEPLEYVECALDDKLSSSRRNCFRIISYLLAVLVIYVGIGVFIGWLVWA
jgi:hypothetical protein